MCRRKETHEEEERKSWSENFSITGRRLHQISLSALSRQHKPRHSSKSHPFPFVISPTDVNHDCEPFPWQSSQHAPRNHHDVFSCFPPLPSTSITLPSIIPPHFPSSLSRTQNVFSSLPPLHNSLTLLPPWWLQVNHCCISHLRQQLSPSGILSSAAIKGQRVIISARDHTQHSNKPGTSRESAPNSEQNGNANFLVCNLRTSRCEGNKITWGSLWLLPTDWRTLAYLVTWPASPLSPARRLSP